ncbi:LuxR C-terminal-related transcriptional regulator [Sneathiella litorea]|uniref:HTH luxR-type domain-containing protein n=1 Tax=Sneathiella litorea TaxID=2606216 RepID=A0A6L8W411_9PROT|nr:LuxR C-terminal-related transcriptional regulator [Sneathiella litorea]MZR29835.1 hypothetical protein [Sneathiella litorea]
MIRKLPRIESQALRTISSQDNLQLIARPRLLKTLDDANAGRLIFIHAPAGYGKSSILAQWVHHRTERGELTCWLNLRESDREVSVLTSNLWNSITSVLGDDKELPDLGGLSDQDIYRLIRNRLAKAEGSLTIILDDYHMSSSTKLNNFIGALARDKVCTNHCFVICSHSRPEIPVGGLWVRGDLKSLDINDLRMSRNEVAEMFEAAGEPAQQSLIDSVYNRTEGWAVAVKMARLISAEQQSYDLFKGFDGKQADVATYLAERVVSNLSADALTLLKSIVPLSHFNEELLEHMAAVENCAETLQELESCGVPISRDSDNENWRRLHPIFRDFLLSMNEMEKVEFPAILEKATTWFARRGDIEEAVTLALETNLVTLAADIAESAGGWRLIYKGLGNMGPRIVDLVERLPEESWQHFPKLILGHAVASAKSGNLSLAEFQLERFERNVAAMDDGLAREFRLIKLLLFLYSDRQVPLSELPKLENSLASIATDDYVQIALSHNLLCFQYLENSMLDQARRYGDLAIQSFQNAGALFGEVHLYTHLGQAHYFDGDLKSAVQHYRTMIEKVRQNLGEKSDLDAIGQVLYAETLVEQGDLEAGEQILNWALPHIADNDSWFDILAAGYYTAVRIQKIRKNDNAALAILDQAAQTGHRRDYGRLRRFVMRERISLLASIGLPSEAAALAESKGLGEESISKLVFNTLPSRLRGDVPAIMWARIYFEQQRYDLVLNTLAALEEAQDSRSSFLRQLKLNLLKLRTYLAMQDMQVAGKLGDQILLNAASLNYCASFLDEGDLIGDFIQRRARNSDLSPILGERYKKLASRLAAIVKPKSDLHFTTREESVLQCLKKGLSNKEIARTLNISENTVKFHVKSIFRKLNCTSRTQAVLAAREITSN